METKKIKKGRKMPGIKVVRLCVSGAVLGVAIAGLLGTLFGFTSPSHDVIGAGAGAGATALLLKLSHLA